MNASFIYKKTSDNYDFITKTRLETLLITNIHDFKKIDEEDKEIVYEGNKFFVTNFKDYIKC